MLIATDSLFRKVVITIRNKFFVLCVISPLLIKGAYDTNLALKSYYTGGEKNDSQNQVNRIVSKELSQNNISTGRPSVRIETRVAGNVSRQERQIAESIANYYGLSNADILYAISWHETQHGKLGAGKQGYHMGVGVPTNGAKKPRFKGWVQQCDWVAQRLARCQRANGNELTHKTILQYANMYHKPDNRKAWANSVWTVYSR